ncbi:hypothetical protein PR048_011244 [Dryococelus australis]|uniref:Uncharacterized protein n=1 Tax=Dryococelus australis TaxID=614101 RepID=A0ABQ9HL27_9NEOP|nr:hypothetical protein PR048_011244 [Dryococelus australis]
MLGTIYIDIQVCDQQSSVWALVIMLGQLWLCKQEAVIKVATCYILLGSGERKTVYAVDKTPFSSICKRIRLEDLENEASPQYRLAVLQWILDRRQVVLNFSD